MCALKTYKSRFCWIADFIESLYRIAYKLYPPDDESVAWPMGITKVDHTVSFAYFVYRHFRWKSATKQGTESNLRLLAQAYLQRVKDAE